MKSFFLKFIGFTVAILVVAFVALTFTLDGIVKSAIESHGSEILGTELTVGSVSISPFSGKGTIRNLTIMNPEEFDERSALSIESIDIEIEPRSLLSDTVVITHLEINDMDVYFEQQLAGNNFGRLNRNLNAYTADAAPAEKVMVIDRFVISESKLTLHTDIGDFETVEVILPPYEQTGIGREDGETVTQSMQVVLRLIVRHISEEGLKQVIEEGGRDLLERAGDAIRNLFQ